MLLLFLSIGLFFKSTFSSFQCIQNSSCNLILQFNQTIPSGKDLGQQCGFIETKACSVYLSIDFDNQQASITFNDRSDQIKSPTQSFHYLLGASPDAPVVRRYIVQVQAHPQCKTHLHILLQCESGHHCSINLVRHYWHRFTSIQKRASSSKHLCGALLSSSPQVTKCFDDQRQQFANCSKESSACLASTDEQRKCMVMTKNHTKDFIYAFNQVDSMYQLANESVFYELICHKNDCNDNKTIQKLSYYAREFADYTTSAKYPTYQHSSKGIQLSHSFYRSFSMRLFLVSTIFFL